MDPSSIRQMGCMFWHSAELLHWCGSSTSCIRKPLWEPREYWILVRFCCYLSRLWLASSITNACKRKKHFFLSTSSPVLPQNLQMWYREDWEKHSLERNSLSGSRALRSQTNLVLAEEKVAAVFSRLQSKHGGSFSNLLWGMPFSSCFLPLNSILRQLVSGWLSASVFTFFQYKVAFQQKYLSPHLIFVPCYLGQLPCLSCFLLYSFQQVVVAVTCCWGLQ